MADESGTALWSMGGLYEQRPALAPFASLLSDSTEGAGLPILIYDVKESKKVPNNNNNNNSGEYNEAEVAPPSLEVPRFIARKVRIPAPSDRPLKVITLAPPLPTHQTISGATTGGVGGKVTATTVVTHSNSQTVDPIPMENSQRNGPEFNIDTPETQVVQDSHPGRQKGDWILLSTAIPTPSQFLYLLPLVLFLADLAVLIATLVVTQTTKRIIAASCVCVVVPDVLVLVCVFRKGVIVTTIGVHLMIWPVVILLFLQVYINLFMLIHIIIASLMILYLLRMRSSLSGSFYPIW